MGTKVFCVSGPAAPARLTPSSVRVGLGRVGLGSVEDRIEPRAGGRGVDGGEGGHLQGLRLHAPRDAVRQIRHLHVLAPDGTMSEDGADAFTAEEENRELTDRRRS